MKQLTILLFTIMCLSPFREEEFFQVSLDASNDIPFEQGDSVNLTTAKSYIQKLNSENDVELIGGVYSVIETLFFHSQDVGKEGIPII